MKKMMVKNLIIVALCLTIIFLSIGFGVISMKLDESKDKVSKYDVSVDRVVLGTITKGGNIEPSSTYEIINGDKTVKFMFQLYNPNDGISYSVFIKNKGDISAKIDKVIESLNYNKDELFPIEIGYDNIDGEILEPNSEVELIITIKYGDGLSKYNKIPYEISILASALE